jgi:hypothetical protein
MWQTWRLSNCLTSFLFGSMDNTPNLTDMVKHGLIRLVNDELSLFFKQLLN